MKKCPGCSYLWADDYNGVCTECGKPLGGIGGADSGLQDLRFRYADQQRKAVREDEFERSAKRASGKARPGDAYDRADIPDGILDVARGLLVQREEVKYE